METFFGVVAIILVVLLLGFPALVILLGFVSIFIHPEVAAELASKAKDKHTKWDIERDIVRDINPASGLPMVGDVDVHGNPFGVDFE